MIKIGDKVKNKYTGYTGTVIQLCPVTDAAVVDFYGSIHNTVNLRDYTLLEVKNGK